MRAILSKCCVEKCRKENTHARTSVFSHKIFTAMAEITRGLDRMSFSQAKDLIGRSLREDYSLIEQANSSKSTNNLRVQIDDSLPLISSPYIKTALTKRFTLVLDLDETLLHYMESNNTGATEGILNIRPGAEDFLLTLSQHFEIVIFTAAMQDYADWAI